MEKTKNHPNQETEHHIVPRSRIKGKGIEGVSKVFRYLHERYHHLFGNMIPEEICEWLNQTFWNGNYLIIIKKKGSVK